MEIAQIKQQLTLKQVLDYYGLKTDKQNRLNCPFHDDKTPSLQVYYKTQTCYCFSSNCSTHGKSMDVIDFIMHKEQISKHEAILKAKELIGGTASPVQQLTRAAILSKMFIYFKNAIHNSQPAKDYIEGRNLDHTKLEIGYNSGQFHHGTRKDQYLIDSCVKVGLLSRSGTNSRTGGPAYKPFGKNGIVFPLKGKDGKIISLYFRNVQEKGHMNRHFYLKDRQGLYPKYPKPGTRKLILTEAIIDAATLLQQKEITADFEILSLYGTNGLTEEHQSAIRELKELEEVVFWFDGDASGNKAAEKYTAILREAKPGIKLSQVETPPEEDINSLLDGHQPQILADLLSNRKPLAVPGSTSLFSSNEKSVEPVERKNPGMEADPPQEPEANKELNTQNPGNLIYQGQAAEYRVKGFKVNQLDSLKVSLQIIKGERDFRARVELYDYKQTGAVSQKAAQALGTEADRIEKEISRLTTLLEEYRDNHQSENPQQQKQAIKVPESTVPQCLELLKSKDYFKRLNELIGATGVIGEETSRLLLYVVASTYKSEQPLHALVQGSSGSGKTHLITSIAGLMPPEDTSHLTRVTESSFYNYGEHELSHRLLIMEDLDGLKEEAFLAFRELQSRGMLNSSTSVKDEQGNISSAIKTVRGPIASLSATTKGEIYEDNMSRSLVIAVDESQQQTQRVIENQNQEAAGTIDFKARQKATEFLQHCMRLTKAHEVVNPFAGKIRLPEEAQKIRRLNQLYQSFVKQVTILHQYQRKRDKQGRLISEKQDLKTACQILFDCIVLKVDELDGSLRNYFEQLKQYVKSKAEKENKSQSDTDFTRMEIRQALKVSKTRQHVYMQELQDFEYVQQVNGYANKGYRYKIGYWDSLEALRARIQDHLDKQLEKL